MKRVLAFAVAAILLTAAAYYFLSGKRAAEEAVSAGPVKRYAAAEGKVEALPGFEVEVGSEIDGRIAEILAEEGDYVEKGGLIARLENGDIRAKLKEAEAEAVVAKARYKETASGAREEEIKKAKAALERAAADMDTAAKEYERYEQLFRKGFVSMSDVDEKERVFRVAAARVKEAGEERTLLEKGPKPETLRLYEDSVKSAEANALYFKRLLEKTYIMSPISGKVIRKYLHKGEMISKEMQTAIVAVADVEKIRINAEVDETDIGKVHIGDIAEITSDAYPAKIYKGKVHEISDYVGGRKIKPNDSAKNLDMKVIQVKIELPEKTPFKLGMTVNVRIMPKEQN